jgi:catechol 2,3-dioxygenase-like lactoylglutathione lyase family enzyme
MTDSGPVLNLLTLVVKDMEASVAFYRRLGVTVPDADPAWPDIHRGGSSGGMSVDFDTESFAPKWNAGHKTSTTAVIGIQLPSREAVDSAYDELTSAGHAGQQEPYDAFWGARYAVVEDPDGNAVGLMSPIDPDRRSAPPDMNS